MSYLKHLAGIALFVFTIWLFASNPFADCAHVDSAVFWYVGDALHRGLVPYRDAFDHKGPLLYLLNYLGSGCGTSLTRLWLLEVLFWLGSFLMVFRFVRKWFERENPLLALLAYAALFFGFLMEGSGNLTESWAAPLILYVLLAILDALLAERLLPDLRCLLIGVCTAGILLLRPNMAAVSFVAAGYWFAEIGPRGIKIFVRKLAWAVFGVLLVLVPTVLWYWQKGALPDLWKCYVLFNLTYIRGAGEWNAEYAFGLPFVAVNLWGLFAARGPLRRALAYNFAFQALAFGVIMIKPGLRHYFVAYVPACALPAMYLFSVCRTRLLTLLAVMAATFVLLLCFVRANFNLAEYVRSVRSGGRIGAILDFREGCEMSSVRDFLKLIGKGDTVCVLGNCCEVYRKLDLRADFRYFYQDPPRAYSKEIDAAVTDYVASGRCRWFVLPIVIERGDLAERLWQAQYREKDRKGTYILYGRQE